MSNVEQSQHAACTVLEGEYHFGLAALVNSLHRSGFVGRVFVPLGDTLPPWAKSPHDTGNSLIFSPCSSIQIVFQKTSYNLPYVDQKPRFMLDVLDKHPEIKQLHYFDADVTLRANWNELSDWATGTIALCEDLCSPEHSTSPLRRRWCEFWKNHDLALTSDDPTYVNAGYVGVDRAQSQFLVDWDKMISIANEHDPSCFWPTSIATDKYSRKGDQDILNCLLMTGKYPTSIVRKQGMGFDGNAIYMCHTVGPNKPWKGSYSKHVLRTGSVLSDAFRHYHLNSKGVVCPYSPLQMLFRNLDLLVAKLLGRIL